MTSDNKQLRNIARDVRFLTYRAGAIHPIARWLFLSMLSPLVLIFVVTLVVELAIEFKIYTPKHQQQISHTTESLNQKGTIK
jgi:hypothetical protein